MPTKPSRAKVKKETVSTKTAAEFLGVSAYRLRKLTQKGKVQAARLDGEYRYSREELENVRGIA